MAQTVRVILYTTNESSAPELRRAITSLSRFRIVAELDEASLLSHAVAQFPCDLILADLDPSAPVVIECLRQLRESHPDLPIFALSKQTQGEVVLQAMKAGIKEYLVKPLSVEELDHAVSRVISTDDRAKEPGKLVSVMGSAGGVGCTTIATNLAVELADLVGPDEKVAIVDFDFRFGQVATLLDVRGKYTVADLCSTPEDLDPQMVLKALIKHDSGVHVLGRPHTFAQAEMITAAHCANVLTSLQEMCAYVVVDGPTRHDPGGRSVLDASDFNLMIVQLLVTNVRNADRMIQELANQGFNTERISLVYNRLGRESAHLTLEQVESILGHKMFASITDDWKNVSASVNIGQPLRQHCEKSKVRREIRHLAKLLHCPETLAANSPKQGGLLGRILGKTSASASGREESVEAALKPATQG